MDEGLRLTNIYAYPVKSCKGLSLTSARVVDTGFEHDRQWMVVDAHGKFVTQRTQPKLVLVETALTGEHLVLSSPGIGEVRVPLHREPGAAETVTVWHDTLAAREESAEAASFFSDLLGAPHRLVRFPAAGERKVPTVEKGAAPIKRGAADAAEEGTASTTHDSGSITGRRVQFADAYPFLLISQGSLDLLNEKLSAKGEPPVAMERFRPNLVIAGCDPHAEDTWNQIQIGEIWFDVAKPCARCAIPQVDPATAMMGREPARTLATYRRSDGKVLFGQNLVHHDLGHLRVGAIVSVL